MIGILLYVGILTPFKSLKLFSSMLIFKVALPDSVVVILVLLVWVRQAHERLLWICVEK